jgi:hypothetical protein
MCLGSTPLDFHTIPWWRDDLVEQKLVKSMIVNTWQAKRIRATPSKPKPLPSRITQAQKI